MTPTKYKADDNVNVRFIWNDDLSAYNIQYNLTYFPLLIIGQNEVNANMTSKGKNGTIRHFIGVGKLPIYGVELEGLSTVTYVPEGVITLVNDSTKRQLTITVDIE